MKNTGEAKNKFVTTAIIITLMVLFGTAAIANAAHKYSINSISGLSFSGASNTTIATQSFGVSDTSQLNPAFTATTDQAWLYISNASATTASGATVSVGANTAGLAAGIYKGHVIITIPNRAGRTWANSPYDVPVTLTVISSAAIAPSITMQPAGQTITAGKTASFNVAASGTAPITYQWSMNGTAISGATSSTYTTPAETTSSNNAAFTVAASNSAGNATSNAAVLTVNAAPVAPSITAQPTSQTIVAGKTAIFNVAATGTAPMTYQWRMNGTAISGATSSTYTTPAETTSSNNVAFTVAVSNSAGNATSNAAVLTVNAAPVAPSITAQPASQTIVAGNTATFTVVATGTAPMTYQWSMNGVPIGGATSSSYTTPAETPSSNNAQFTVAVSNSVNTATSNAATLTVNASTLILNSSSTSLNFGSVNVASNTTQNVTLTNAGNSSITISNVSVSGAGYNASGVSSGLILAPGQTATLTATFTPSASGSMTGSITVASNSTNSPDSIALSGNGVSTTTHGVALSWNSSAPNLIGFNAYSSTVSGGPYAKLTSTPVTSTSYTDSTVQAGLTYYYVVTAVATGNVESAVSSEVSALVP